MKPTNYHPQRDQIIDLYRKGHAPRHISAWINLDVGTVRNILTRARRIGAVPKHVHKKKHGTIHGMLESLDLKTRLWLYEQTPDGATVADTLRGIVVDEYDRENE